MLSYSPYDNVRAQAYPAMLVTTGLWDSQVQYYEPAKWVAKLRDANRATSPAVARRIWKPATAASPAGTSVCAKIAREYGFYHGSLGG